MWLQRYFFYLLFFATDSSSLNYLLFQNSVYFTEYLLIKEIRFSVTFNTVGGNADLVVQCRALAEALNTDLVKSLLQY